MIKKKTSILLGFAFLISLILVVSCSPIRTPSSTPPFENATESNVIEYEYGPGDYEFDLIHDGLTRKYLVHVPTSYDTKTPTPIILNFHGGGGSAEGHQETSMMNEKSDLTGFLVIYPRGTRRDRDPNKLYLRFWNIGNGPGGPYYSDADPLSNTDDIGFVNALLDDVESKFNVDKKRVYAAGLSNGGILSHLLACELSDRIAAVASVAGPFWTFPESCNPSKPVSIMHFHGTADVCAPFNGGLSKCTSRDADIDRFFISAKETISIWTERNNCPFSSHVTYQNGNVICETYGPCDENTEVSLCTIEGGGHTWPGGRPYSIPGTDIGETTKDINANDAMWDFFVKHPMEDSSQACGDNICEDGENVNNCPEDCRESACGNGICEDDETDKDCPEDCCSSIYNIHKNHEQECIEMGWNRIIVDVDGIPRRVLWKGPARWGNGAIITLHGGGGAASNFCYNDVWGGDAGAHFGNLAVEQGFAVFSLDSTYNQAMDPEGRGIGKRFDCLEIPNRENVDLPFIEKVITESIPELRPEGSAQDIFVTGISTGGFTTVLAATHLNDKITAFAPVSGGDPYGIYFDMGTHPGFERECTPGVMLDSETNLQINLKNSCQAEAYLNEKEWPQVINSIPFRQFHHELDCTCDISCMRKAREHLIEQGYEEDNEGPFILTLSADPEYLRGLCFNDLSREGRKWTRGEKWCCVEDHFWQEQYNQPVLDFFKKHVSP